MKTKYALFALCLPIAFTACQNEEFVKDYSQELKNRGEIDVILSASYPTVGNAVDTRMSAEEDGDALNFLWEKGTDRLGAAMMDEETAGTVNGAEIFANYPFEAQSSGATSTFASPSSITKGIYLFYNSYKNVVDREALSLSLQTQEYDPTNTAKTSAQQMVKYMNMVAPMVNLNKGLKLEDAAAFKLPLEFVNLYTPVKVPVMFKNAPEGTKLTKITINGGSDFILGGELQPKVLGGTQNANVLALVDGAIDPAKLAAAKKAIEEIVQAGSGVAGIYTTTGDKLVKGAAELSIKGGMALGNDKVQNFWILIPRGKYATLKVNAETTNGNMIEKTIVVPATAEGTDKSPQDFTSETRKIGTVELDFNAGGNVTQPYDFTINSTTDWDNYIQYVKDHLESYVGRDITFTIGAGKSVYVAALPEFGFKLAGGDASSKLIFGKEDKTTVSAQLDLSGITMGDNVNIEVGEGATVTLRKVQKDGTIASLTNNGTLTVEAIGTITTLTNNKTLNFGSSKNTAELTVTKVDNESGATINVKTKTTFTAFTNKAKTTTKDAAKIVVEKEASLALPGTSNAGTIENHGTLTNTSGFANNGTVDNYGVLKVTNSWTNNGTIIAQNGSESNSTTIAGNGIIEVMNPTTYVALETGKKYDEGSNTQTAVVTNRKDYLAAKDAMSVTLSGGEWSIVANEAAPTDASREVKVEEVVDLNLQADLNVKETADLNSISFTVTGASTIKTAEDKSLTVKAITVNKNATATIAADAKVIIAKDQTVAVNGTLTNNGSLITPAVMDAVTNIDGTGKINITIASGAKLTNNKTIGGELNTQAVITVNGELDNSKGTIYGTNNIENAEVYKKGIVRKFPKVKVNNANLTAFAGATEIEAVTTAVTTLPANTDVNITVASDALALVASTKYGKLTISAATTMTAGGTGAVIEKITIGKGVTLIVSGDNAITCNSLDKTASGADLTDGSSHLIDADGTAWITK